MIRVGIVRWRRELRMRVGWDDEWILFGFLWGRMVLSGSLPEIAILLLSMI